MSSFKILFSLLIYVSISFHPKKIPYAQFGNRPSPQESYMAILKRRFRDEILVCCDTANANQPFCIFCCFFLVYIKRTILASPFPSPLSYNYRPWSCNCRIRRKTNIGRFEPNVRIRQHHSENALRLLSFRLKRTWVFSRESPPDSGKKEIKSIW